MLGVATCVSCYVFGGLKEWMEMGSIILSEISQVVKQIPYDLTYKWNLINKTNQLAKYNQRHGNMEQTDSN